MSLPLPPLCLGRVCAFVFGVHSSDMHRVFPCKRDSLWSSAESKERKGCARQAEFAKILHVGSDVSTESPSMNETYISSEIGAMLMGTQHI